MSTESTESKIGVWRLSNTRYTFYVTVDSDKKIIDAAPIAKRFLNRPFEDVCRWMQQIGYTNIMLMRTGPSRARQVSTDSQEAD